MFDHQEPDRAPKKSHPESCQMHPKMLNSLPAGSPCDVSKAPKWNKISGVKMLEPKNE